MITLLVGRPGGGKTYETVVHHILPALQSGRRVVTNIPLNLPAMASVDPSWVDLLDVRQPTAKALVPFSTLDCYSDKWKHPESGVGVLYVIDECHIPLPSGKATPRPVEEWFSLHRHEGVDVVLITQSHQKVSRNIVKMVEKVEAVRKNIAIGSDKSYTYQVKSDPTARGTIYRTEQRRYNAAYFRFYQSYTKGGQGEAKADGPTVWGHWSFKLAAGVFALGVGMIAWNGLPGAGGTPAKAEVSAQPIIRRPPQPATAPQERQAAPADLAAAETPLRPVYRPLEPMEGYSAVVTGLIGGGAEEPVYYLLISWPDGRRTKATSIDMKLAGWRVDAHDRCAVDFRSVQGVLRARC